MIDRKSNVRVLSAVISALLAVQSTGFASLEIRLAEMPLFQQKPGVSFVVPRSISTVSDAYDAASERTLILIQDAHTNESAQMNIARTLDLLMETNPTIRYAFMEAGTGDNSLTFLRGKADSTQRERIGRDLMRKGYLSGAEYLDLTSDRSLVLWGVEDKGLYWQAVRAYAEVAKGRETYRPYLDRIGSAIDSLKGRIYGPALKSFDGVRSSYLSGKMPVTDYIDAILQAADLRSIASTHYPSLVSLKRIQALESAIDFKKANEEQVRAVAALPQAERDELMAASTDPSGRSPFKMGRADEKIKKAYFAFLEEKLPAVGKYGELQKYFSYLKETASIDPRTLLEEQEMLERSVYDSLIQSPDERSLHEASEALRSLKGMLELTLTPKEYRRFESRRDIYDIVRLTGFLNRKIMDLDQLHERASFIEPGFEAFVRTADTYYELTRDRDEKFIENLSHKMEEEGQETAVLITGGYHTPNLSAMLREKGISYLVVTPQVLQETDLEKYEKVLLSQGQADQTMPLTLVEHPIGQALAAEAFGVSVHEFHGARLASRKEENIRRRKEREETAARQDRQAASRRKFIIGAVSAVGSVAAGSLATQWLGDADTAKANDLWRDHRAAATQAGMQEIASRIQRWLEANEYPHLDVIRDYFEQIKKGENLTILQAATSTGGVLGKSLANADDASKDPRIWINARDVARVWETVRSEDSPALFIRIVVSGFVREAWGHRMMQRYPDDIRWNTKMIRQVAGELTLIPRTELAMAAYAEKNKDLFAEMLANQIAMETFEETHKNEFFNWASEKGIYSDDVLAQELSGIQDAYVDRILQVSAEPYTLRRSDLRALFAAEMAIMMRSYISRSRVPGSDDPMLPVWNVFLVLQGKRHFQSVGAEGLNPSILAGLQPVTSASIQSVADEMFAIASKKIGTYENQVRSGARLASSGVIKSTLMAAVAVAGLMGAVKPAAIQAAGVQQNTPAAVASVTLIDNVLSVTDPVTGNVNRIDLAIPGRYTIIHPDGRTVQVGPPQSSGSAIGYAAALGEIASLIDRAITAASQAGNASEVARLEAAQAALTQFRRPPVVTPQPTDFSMNYYVTNSRTNYTVILSGGEIIIGRQVTQGRSSTTTLNIADRQLIVSSVNGQPDRVIRYSQTPYQYLLAIAGLHDTVRYLSEYPDLPDQRGIEIVLNTLMGQLSDFLPSPFTVQTSDPTDATRKAGAYVDVRGYVSAEIENGYSGLSIYPNDKVEVTAPSLLAVRRTMRGQTGPAVTQKADERTNPGRWLEAMFQKSRLLTGIATYDAGLDAETRAKLYLADWRTQFAGPVSILYRYGILSPSGSDPSVIVSRYGRLIYVSELSKGGHVWRVTVLNTATGILTVSTADQGATHVSTEKVLDPITDPAAHRAELDRMRGVVQRTASAQTDGQQIGFGSLLTEAVQRVSESVDAGVNDYFVDEIFVGTNSIQAEVTQGRTQAVITRLFPSASNRSNQYHVDFQRKEVVALLGLGGTVKYTAKDTPAEYARTLDQLIAWLSEAEQVATSPADQANLRDLIERLRQAPTQTAAEFLRELSALPDFTAASAPTAYDPLVRKQDNKIFVGMGYKAVGRTMDLTNGNITYYTGYTADSYPAGSAGWFDALNRMLADLERIAAVNPQNSGVLDMTSLFRKFIAGSGAPTDFPYIIIESVPQQYAVSITRQGTSVTLSHSGLYHTTVFDTQRPTQVTYSTTGGTYQHLLGVHSPGFIRGMRELTAALKKASEIQPDNTAIAVTLTQLERVLADAEARFGRATLPPGKDFVGEQFSTLVSRKGNIISGTYTSDSSRSKLTIDLESGVFEDVNLGGVLHRMTPDEPLYETQLYRLQLMLLQVMAIDWRAEDALEELRVMIEAKVPQGVFWMSVQTEYLSPGVVHTFTGKGDRVEMVTMKGDTVGPTLMIDLGDRTTDPTMLAEAIRITEASLEKVHERGLILNHLDIRNRTHLAELLRRLRDLAMPVLTEDIDFTATYTTSDGVASNVLNIRYDAATKTLAIHDIAGNTTPRSGVFDYIFRFDGQDTSEMKASVIEALERAIASGAAEQNPTVQARLKILLDLVRAAVTTSNPQPGSMDLEFTGTYDEGGTGSNVLNIHYSSATDEIQVRDIAGNAERLGVFEYVLRLSGSNSSDTKAAVLKALDRAIASGAAAEDPEKRTRLTALRGRAAESAVTPDASLPTPESPLRSPADSVTPEPSVQETPAVSAAKPVSENVPSKAPIPVDTAPNQAEAASVVTPIIGAVFIAPVGAGSAPISSEKQPASEGPQPAAAVTVRSESPAPEPAPAVAAAKTEIPEVTFFSKEKDIVKIVDRQGTWIFNAVTGRLTMTEDKTSKDLDASNIEYRFQIYLAKEAVRRAIRAVDSDKKGSDDRIRELDDLLGEMERRFRDARDSGARLAEKVDADLREAIEVFALKVHAALRRETAGRDLAVRIGEDLFTRFEIRERDSGRTIDLVVKTAGRSSVLATVQDVPARMARLRTQARKDKAALTSIGLNDLTAWRASQIFAAELLPSGNLHKAGSAIVDIPLSLYASVSDPARFESQVRLAVADVLESRRSRKAIQGYSFSGLETLSPVQRAITERISREFGRHVADVRLFQGLVIRFVDVSLKNPPTVMANAVNLPVSALDADALNSFGAMTLFGYSLAVSADESYDAVKNAVDYTAVKLHEEQVHYYNDNLSDRSKEAAAAKILTVISGQDYRVMKELSLVLPALKKIALDLMVKLAGVVSRAVGQAA